MFPHQCLFCDHVNPVGAKFCNDCGSPLHLKPCKQCEAINDHAAENCYQCGAADPALVIASREVESLTSGTAASARPGDEGFDHGHPARVESMMHDGDTFSPRLGDATTSNRETDAREGTGYPALETARAVHAGPLAEFRATTGPRPSLRITPTEILPALLLIALAFSAFHVYRNPLQLREWLDAAKLATAPSGGRPTQSIPVTTNVPASPEPRANPGTGRVAVDTSDGPTSTNTGSVAVPRAPVLEGGPAATGRNGADGEAATPNRSPFNTTTVPPPPASASDRATPARPAGPEEDNPGTAGATAQSAAESRAKTTLAAGKHGNPKKTPATVKTAPKKSKKASPKNPAPTKPPPAPNTTAEPSKTARRE
jgi:ribosomal protein L40E